MQDLLSETQKQWPKSLSKNLLVSGMLRATGCSDYQEKANNSWLLPSMEVIQRRQHFDYNYADLHRSAAQKQMLLSGHPLYGLSNRYMGFPTVRDFLWSFGAAEEHYL